MLDKQLYDLATPPSFLSIGTIASQHQQTISMFMDEVSDCNDLYVKGSNYNGGGNYQMAYDTLRKFIEQCANVKVFNGQEIVFGELDGAVQYRSSKDERFVEYRDWLKSVLYLNRDTGIPGMRYYCRAVQSLWYTFNYNPPTGTDFKAMQAILKYVVDSGKCDLYFSDYEEILEGLRKEQYNYYIDTCKDTIATPFDTTWLPTLEEINMTILRGPQNSLTPATPEPHLGELIATRNPFADVLELKYRLAKSGMVRIDVYDLLGRAVYAEGQGYKQDGEHVLSLQAKSWSPGRYYVRLSTPSGDVKTVKVVKE